ncbi:NACHT domain-containing protein [Streptomyces sp. NPDC002920]
MAQRGGELDETASLTAVLGFGLSAIGLAVNLWRESAASERADETSSLERLQQLADRLASAVQEQWQAEWRLRRLQDPSPLQVQWSPAEAWLVDESDGTGQAAESEDQLEGVSAAFDAVPSRRMVVLGSPGSGKTVLAVRFTLDRLAHRASGDPVPVVFPLSGWQPERERLRDWMANYLRATYPGAHWSRELLNAGLVLPVLDGLDEMPESSWGTALHRLNAELDPGQGVLLTCRTQTYAKAVETGDVFTQAAVIELQPLAFASASAYLVRTARPVRGADGQRTTLWDPVLAHLRAHADTPLGRALHLVLSTPLMVAMARAVYGDTGKDPADLLEERFADPAVLEQHLLEAFVPAAFTDSPYAERARDWLGYLAASMQRRSTRRLAWWQLRLELPWPLRRLGPILLLGSAAVALSTVMALARGVFTEGLWTPASDLPLVMSVFIGGVCLGYLALGGRPAAVRAGVWEGRQVARDVLLLAATAALAGMAVGFTTHTYLTTWSWSLPITFGDMGSLAMAAACGLATATALAVLGIVGDPLPLYTPLARRPLVRAVVIVLLTALLALLVTSIFSLPLTWSAVAAALAAVLVAAGLYDRQSSAAGAASPPAAGRRRRRRLLRALLRGLTAGLLAGLCLGSAFGIAAATTLSIRGARHADFPHGTPHRLPDGTRYVITADGWRHGLHSDGDRYLRTPGPVDGVVEEYEDGTRYARAAASLDEATRCSADRCTPFHGPIELHVRKPDEYPEIRLPNGTYADDYDLVDRLPPARSRDWLLTAPPSALFGIMMDLALTVGVALGLVSGLTSAIHTWLVSPADTARAVSPQAGLRTDRTTAITRGVTLTVLSYLITAGLVILPIGSERESGYLLFALLPWLFVGPLAICLSAWGWFLVTRLWLSTTGRLPWHLMDFLDEAHERGVLRQAGATYEFRHARLQEHLAASTQQQSLLQT